MQIDIEPELEKTEPSPSSSIIEQITMECMMNKKHYRKYLAKTDISRFQEIQEKMNRIEQVRDEITEITQEMLTDIIKCCGESSKYNTKIQSTFDAYLNACLDYINTTTVEQDDEDMLFPSSNIPIQSSKINSISGRDYKKGDFGSTKTSNSRIGNMFIPRINQETPMDNIQEDGFHSYWGKSIRKVN